MKPSSIVVVVLLWALSGCDSPPPGADVTLSNGARVVVGTDGRVALFEGERALWALGAGPVARTFTERVSGPFAIWTFERRSEQRFDFDRYLGTDEEGDVVRVRYGRAGEGSAVLAIAPGERPRTTVVRLEVSGIEGARSLALGARCDDDGSFHGFGEQYSRTDQRGEAFTLLVSEQGIGREGGGREIAGDEHTTYFPMPYYLDGRGFGVLARTDHRVEVDVCATDPEVAWLEVIDDAPVELVVFHGPTPLDVIAQLGDEVGRPAQPPEWAFGTWISAQGGRDAVLAKVAELEAADIAVSAIWSQDWTGVRMNADGGFGVQYRWRADEAHYPDLSGMISDLRARGIRFLAYANPFIAPNLPDHFETMRDGGMLIRDESGEAYVFPAPNGTSSHPDLTNDAAFAYVQGELEAMVRGLGIDGWMADFGEWNPLDAVMSDGSEPVAYHNRFPVDWHRVNRAAMDAARPDGDWVLFARSGWTGVQRHSMIHWVGDQEATWSETDGLPTVVPAMINLGLAGVPYVTHDIAGFSGGPSTKELYLRWTELGAFTPILRTHEGNRRNLNHDWNTDAETIAHFRRFSRIHDALRPELVALAAEAQATGAPMVRHLMLEHGEDRATWSISDQYLLGSDLLVAPITEEGATRRPVYLPAGAQWFHVWTGTMYEGGRTIEIDAPIGSPPVFSRDRDRADLRAIE
jgi:alpha-glucosidase